MPNDHSGRLAPAGRNSGADSPYPLHMRRAITPCALFFLAAAVAATTGPNPKAPAETVQFSFLIGEWSCSTRRMQPDGSVADGPPARWSGRYILDGWAIQDVWVSAQPDGSAFHGTNIRSFNPETGKWDNRWLSQDNLQWKYFSAEKVGETMVMTGEGTDGQGRAFVDRNIFYDIGADSWKWRKDRSYDGGETWIEGVGHIAATRAP